jgi:hypothetical protein
LVDIVGESRVQITIVENVAAGTNIVRIKFSLWRSKEKIQKHSSEARSEGPYQKELKLPTPLKPPLIIDHVPHPS